MHYTFWLAALAAGAHANFYWIVGVRGTPPVCVGDTGWQVTRPTRVDIKADEAASFSIPEPATYVNYACPTSYIDSCDDLSGLPGMNAANIGDPVCGDGPDTFSMPSEGVCGYDGQMYFRLAANGFLDAATDSDFNNVVASCHKKPNCGDYGSKGCGTTGNTYTASFLCEPVNGSAC